MKKLYYKGTTLLWTVVLILSIIMTGMHYLIKVVNRTNEHHRYIASITNKIVVRNYLLYHVFSSSILNPNDEWITTFYEHEFQVRISRSETGYYADYKSSRYPGQIFRVELLIYNKFNVEHYHATKWYWFEEEDK